MPVAARRLQQKGEIGCQLISTGYMGEIGENFGGGAGFFSKRKPAWDASLGGGSGAKGCDFLQSVPGPGLPGIKTGARGILPPAGRMDSLRKRRVRSDLSSGTGDKAEKGGMPCPTFSEYETALKGVGVRLISAFAAGK